MYTRPKGGGGVRGYRPLGFLKWQFSGKTHTNLGTPTCCVSGKQRRKKWHRESSQTGAILVWLFLSIIGNLAVTFNPIQLGAVFSPKVGDCGPPFCSVLGCRTAGSHTWSHFFLSTPLCCHTRHRAVVLGIFLKTSSLCNPFQNTF